MVHVRLSSVAAWNRTRLVEKNEGTYADSNDNKKNRCSHRFLRLTNSKNY